MEDASPDNSLFAAATFLKQWKRDEKHPEAMRQDACLLLLLEEDFSSESVEAVMRTPGVTPEKLQSRVDHHVSLDHPEGIQTAEKLESIPDDFANKFARAFGIVHDGMTRMRFFKHATVAGLNNLLAGPVVIAERAKDVTDSHWAQHEELARYLPYDLWAFMGPVIRWSASNKKYVMVQYDFTVETHVNPAAHAANILLALYLVGFVPTTVVFSMHWNDTPRLKCHEFGYARDLTDDSLDALQKYVESLVEGTPPHTLEAARMSFALGRSNDHTGLVTALMAAAKVGESNNCLVTACVARVLTRNLPQTVTASWEGGPRVLRDILLARAPHPPCTTLPPVPDSTQAFKHLDPYHPVARDYAIDGSNVLQWLS